MIVFLFYDHNNEFILQNVIYLNNNCSYLELMVKLVKAF